MYSGTTLRNHSGNVLGAHQKIDRVARKHLAKHLPDGMTFPTAKEIIRFEGKDGPDGIKGKSPARDEPWHYIDPTDPSDIAIVEHIEDHSANLVEALVAGNEERAAFEAAWLAHAIVDGLSPPHHYPLEEKIEELWGHPREQRLTVKQKNIIVGSSRRDTMSKNWQYWGAKGVWTTHFLFEWGFATTIASLNFNKPDLLPEEDRKNVLHEGIAAVFLDAVHHIHHLNMYERFYKKGWTRRLAHQTRQELAPIIIRTVALSWYEASVKAAQLRKDQT